MKEMLDEIEHWNHELEEGINSRREVKARIRQHHLALLKEEEERRNNGSALS
jgi:hypothetical protein